MDNVKKVVDKETEKNDRQWDEKKKPARKTDKQEPKSQLNRQTTKRESDEHVQIDSVTYTYSTGIYMYIYVHVHILYLLQ